MKSIKIDNEVYTYLQKKAMAFEEDPNDVLRRIFNLNQVAKTNTLPLKSSNPMEMRNQPKTNLHDLINDSVLSEGQKLFFKDGAKRLPEYTAIISGKYLIWKGQRYGLC